MLLLRRWHLGNRSHLSQILIERFVYYFRQAVTYILDACVADGARTEVALQPNTDDFRPDVIAMYPPPPLHLFVVGSHCNAVSGLGLLI